MTRSDPNPEGAARAFRVLFVCTANQCRSPMAEYLLRDALRQRWGSAADSWNISSAGTRTRGGRPMDPAALEVLAERGIDGSGFAGRALTPQLIRSADLVLAAAREHRARVAELEPRALSRLFTIQQFGYLARAAAPGPALEPVDAGADLLARARAARAQVPGRTVEDDLADPVGRPVEQFRRCAEELDAAIDGILGAVPAA